MPPTDWPALESKTYWLVQPLSHLSPLLLPICKFSMVCKGEGEGEGEGVQGVRVRVCKGEGEGEGVKGQG
jgi:hypothetical protein